MKSLLQFFVKYYVVLLFLFLEAVALVLFFGHNQFQQAALLSSSNVVSAKLYEAEDDVISYFNLKKENQFLVEENLQLRSEINSLQNRLETVYADSANYICADRDITFFAAKVIHFSANPHSNYLTINRGIRDGVEPDMGVCNKDGVVGVVKASSEHFATVIPVINRQLTISCKFLKNGQIGTLHWQGGDTRFAKLQDIARHNIVQVGDTIITSGLSAIFPADIPVGVVEEANLNESDAYYDIKVKLAVDFRSIENLFVIKHNLREELLELEK